MPKASPPATNSAWHQITTRRIVDYAIYGVRSACNPYIGKLNNEQGGGDGGSPWMPSWRTMVAG
ncbi:MAG UNVERIFIED_CONTAM: hypothetical protein LVR29_23725 [Microcystis novacekii LVE1205-3]